MWRPRTDALARADAVVAIGGDNEEGRGPLADRLVAEGWAPLLVTDIPPSDPRYEIDCRSPTTMCIHPLPLSTQGEARAVAQLARARHWTRVILVVSDDQVSRARLRFTRCFSGDLRVVAVPINYAFWYHTFYADAATVKAEVWQRGC